MMGEVAPSVGIDLVVLAERDDDPATSVAAEVIVGAGTDPAALRAIASCVEVVTLDHELVDRATLSTLAAAGHRIAPSAGALAFASDKAWQRHHFALAGLPVPRVAIIEREEQIESFLATLASPPVVKTPTGGYDGRGVLFPDTFEAARSVIVELLAHGPVLVEEHLDLIGEVALLLVVGRDDSRVLYPVVDTIQRDGMCSETRHPTVLPLLLVREAEDLAHRIADLVEPVGVMAVEFFWTKTGLLINEIALRPHNTGHWTIEGCATSQFENHLRAVAGLPLGPTDAPRASVMVNIVGGPEPLRPAPSGHGDVVYHDYRKAWRPGRKLGHVTVIGDDVTAASVQAWEMAVALGAATRRES
jgi:5-(carboxyamino)imidazole ribonucleotide synthase